MIKLKKLTESQVKTLVKHSQAGDHGALKTLLKAFRPFRKRLARKFSINEFYGDDNVKDVHHQVDYFFISAILDYDPSYNSPATVHIVARTNLDMLNFYRKEVAYQDRFVTYGCLSDLSALPTGGLDDIEAAEMRIDIANALKRCEPIERQMFLLYYYEGMTQEEVASLLGVSRASVQRALSKATNVLRDYMNI